MRAPVRPDQESRAQVYQQDVSHESPADECGLKIAGLSTSAGFDRVALRQAYGVYIHVRIILHQGLGYSQ